MNGTAGILMTIICIILFMGTMTICGMFAEDTPRKWKVRVIAVDILFVLFGWLIIPWVGLGLEKVWYWNMAMVNNHHPNMEVTPPAPIKVQAPLVPAEKRP